MNRILIVDDEKNIRRTFGMVLGSEGFEVVDAGSGEDGIEVLARQSVDLVILDVRLPGIDGIEVLRRIRAGGSQIPVIMISGHGNVATAVKATREGAFDFLEKPCSRERVVLAVRNALRVGRLDREVRDLRRREQDRHLMIGESPAMHLIREQIAKVAPTGARILIRGESGTGKELVARAVHESSDRREGPFIKVNCAAIPVELIESELFGAVKGSYTGATSDREGKFQQADGGTIFLDEIGDMSLRAQAKVLRALQEGEIEKVGGQGVQKVNVRVVAATNRDLEADIGEGRFREDLYYRLNVVPIMVPPLRERREDIPLLADHFLSRYCDENNLPIHEFDDESHARLAAASWPGNVRELHNAIERMAIMASSTRIGSGEIEAAGFGDVLPAPQPGLGTSTHTPSHIQPLAPNAVTSLGGLAKARQQFEAACIRLALQETSGNVSAAARSLGIDRTNLHKKIQSYGLET